MDNGVGVHKVVSHLIEDHQRHRIAFIGGTAGSPEIIARKNAYIRALSDHAFEPDERLIVAGGLGLEAGGLGREEGALAVAELLDERHFSPATLNAIVGANDDVALGALCGTHPSGHCGARLDCRRGVRRCRECTHGQPAAYDSQSESRSTDVHRRA